MARGQAKPNAEKQPRSQAAAARAAKDALARQLVSVPDVASVGLKPLGDGTFAVVVLVRSERSIEAVPKSVGDVQVETRLVDSIVAQ